MKDKDEYTRFSVLFPSVKLKHLDRRQKCGKHWHLCPGLNASFFLISTSYLAGLFDILILLHIWQNFVCFSDFLPLRTLRDAYHKEFES